MSRTTTTTKDLRYLRYTNRSADHADESRKKLPNPVVRARDLQKVRLAWKSRTDQPHIEVSVVVDFDVIWETW